MNVKLVAEDGTQSSEVILSDAIFAAKVNVPLMHQVVTAQLAAARAGSHSSKTRGEVRGGGKKPWRQKGTGRARHGSIREPQWVGGGATFGPKPRDHRVSVPKKMKAIALRSALSARAAAGRVLVTDDLDFDAPKTKRAVTALTAWGVEGKALLVLAGNETAIAYSFRNIPGVHVVAEHQLNVYDVLNADWIVFFRAALEAFQSRAEALPGRREAAVVPPAQAAEPAAEEGPTEASAEVQAAAAPADEVTPE
jgi:large subunit ribosomal protein L4